MLDQVTRIALENNTLLNPGQPCTHKQPEMIQFHDDICQ